MNSSRKMWGKMTCTAIKPEGIPCEWNLQTNEKVPFRCEIQI